LCSWDSFVNIKNSFSFSFFFVAAFTKQLAHSIEDQEDVHIFVYRYMNGFNNQSVQLHKGTETQSQNQFVR